MPDSSPSERERELRAARDVMSTALGASQAENHRLREQLDDRNQDVKILNAEIARIGAVAKAMADTLRAVVVVVDQEQPYPWESGALKQQIREDITAYELLAMDVTR